MARWPRVRPNGRGSVAEAAGFFSVANIILLKVYNTTNMKANTRSDAPTQHYIETRILGQYFLAGALLEKAMWAFYTSWERQRGLRVITGEEWHDIADEEPATTP